MPPGSGRAGACLQSPSRFLVLSERQRYPNLGSRVLAMCLRRLNADWEEHWKHPVLAVESYGIRVSGYLKKPVVIEALRDVLLNLPKMVG